MMQGIKTTFYGLLIFLILLISLFTFLLTTTPGLYTLIKLSTVYLPGTVKIHALKGTALQQFTIGELEYRIDQTPIKIKHISVGLQLSPLIRKQIIINKLSALSVEIGPDRSILLRQFNMKGLLKKEGLTISSLQANVAEQTLSGSIQVDFQSIPRLSARLHLNPDTKNSKRLKGVLNIGGNLHHLQWTGDFHGQGSIELNGSLNELTEINQTVKWHHIQWKIDPSTLINSPEGSIAISGHLPNLIISLTSKINTIPNQNWRIAAKIRGTLPWQWDFDVNISPLISNLKQQGLFTTILAQGNITAANQGDMILRLSPGQYTMPKEGLVPSLSFQGGTLNLALSSQKLVGQGLITLDENKKLNLAFELPQFNLSKGLVDTQPIRAKLSLILDSLEFLQNLSPYISKPKGRVVASLIASGTWGKKSVKSAFELTQGSMELPALGLKLQPIRFSAHAQATNWEAEGSIGSENKTITVKGKGPLTSAFNGDLALTGLNFPVINTKEFSVNISPQMTININSTGIKLSGTLLIPFAHIQPQTFNNSISLSDDVVFKTTEEIAPTPLPFNTQMNLRIEMGNDVALAYKGLNAALVGLVNLIQLPQGPINAMGELTVKKGTYKAYGQNLTVEQGQLLFTGGRLENPGINLRASKKIDTTTATTAGSNQPFDFNNTGLQNANVRGNITVGVEVTGRLTQPKIALFSNPSILSQADILSMLVLGRPANQANKAGGQLLLAAISSMNLGNGTNGTQLLEQLKKNLGFDVDVQTKSNYNLATNQTTDSTAVVVGKSISKKIYVSYNVGLSQNDPNILTLKYLLNKFYSIQVSSSTISNGIDILYTSHKR